MLNMFCPQVHLRVALNILILSIFFFTFQWICLPIILLILVGVELPLRVVVTILECCVTFSGVKLSIRSFFLLLCPKSFPPMSKKWANLAKRWLFISAFQDTNVIVGLRLLTTGTNVTTVFCAQGKK